MAIFDIRSIIRTFFSWQWRGVPLWPGLLVIVAAVGILSFVLIPSRRTAHPKRGAAVEAIYALGTVTSDNILNVSAGVTSNILDVYVQEGDSVRAGARLVLLDQGNPIVAPFSGTIISRAFNKGDIIMPGVPLLILVDMKTRHINLSLDQQAAVKIRPGQSAEINFDGARGRKFSGLVRSLYPKSGQFIARIDVDLPPEFLPDMTADVAVVISRKDNALLVPMQAVSDSHVIRIRNGRKERVKIATGSAGDGQWVEVTTDALTEEDEVVLKK